MEVLEILNRFYVNDLDQSIPFYENILNKRCTSRFKYSQVQLELARVGDILLIGGSDEALKPFRNTNATFRVDSIREFRSYLLENNGVIIKDITTVPTGENMTVKHFDGMVVEYVEFKK